MTSLRLILISVLLALSVISGGCAGGDSSSDDGFLRYGSEGPPKIGVVLGDSEKDRSLNSAVVNGVREAAAGLDTEYTVLAQGDLVDNLEALRFLAENEYDLVVAVGGVMAQDLKVVAPEYPDISFAVFGGEAEQPNVASVRINEGDGAFLAGVAAAHLTKSNLVGFIGGAMSDPETQNWFARGVQYVNMSQEKQVKVMAAYAGVTDTAADDPERGRALGNNLFWSGADIVFTGAGRLDQGLVKAAADNRRIALGKDPNLMNMMPWNVYGVLTEKPEAAVSDIVKKALEGKLDPGRHGYGLVGGVVDFVPGQQVPEEVKNRLAAIKTQIRSGEIKPFEIQVPQDLVTVLEEMPVTGQNKGTGGSDGQKPVSKKPQNGNSGQNPGQAGSPAGDSQPGVPG